MDVGRLLIPFVELAARGFQLLPHRATLEDGVVGILEHLGIDVFAANGKNFLTSGPDIFQENILAVLILTKGLVLEVEVDRARECVGNDKRRRGKVVCTSVRVDTTFKVAVA